MGRKRRILCQELPDEDLIQNWKPKPSLLFERAEQAKLDAEFEAVREDILAKD